MARKVSQPEVSRRKFLAGAAVVGAAASTSVAEAATPGTTAADVKRLPKAVVPSVQQIANETGAQYIDDMRDDDLPGDNGDRDHSYFGLMVFDFRTFMGALGGDVSAFDGFNVENIEPGTTVDYAG